MALAPRKYTPSWPQYLYLSRQSKTSSCCDGWLFAFTWFQPLHAKAICRDWSKREDRILSSGGCCEKFLELG